MSRLSAFICFCLGWLGYDWLTGSLTIDSFEPVYAVGVALTTHWIANR